MPADRPTTGRANLSPLESYLQLVDSYRSTAADTAIVLGQLLDAINLSREVGNGQHAETSHRLRSIEDQLSTIVERLERLDTAGSSDRQSTSEDL